VLSPNRFSYILCVIYYFDLMIPNTHREVVLALTEARTHAEADTEADAEAELNLKKSLVKI
jgi:hypothetical protein